MIKEYDHCYHYTQAQDYISRRHGCIYLKSAIQDRNIENDKGTFMLAKCRRHLEAAAATPLYVSLVPPLLELAGMSETEAHNAFTYYNTEINSYGNDFYGTMGSRFALLFNYLLPSTWFSQRLEAYHQIASAYSSVVDVGFGIPLLPLYATLSGSAPGPHRRFLYLDKFESSLRFGRFFLQVLEKLLPEVTERFQVRFGEYDLDGPSEVPTSLSEVRSLVVALDCIEHAQSPEFALRRLVTNFPRADFLLGLPIGPTIPQHTIEFPYQADAVAFVEACGLKVVKVELIATDWDTDLIGNKEFEGSTFIIAQGTF